MRKIICAILAAALCAALASCAATDGGRSDQPANQNSAKDVIKNMIDAEKQTEAADATETADATEKNDNTNAAEPVYGDLDVDLTALSSTMVYSEVYNMMVKPNEYLGKTVKMNGAFKVAPGDGRNYYLCVVADATACCSQGIEFILADGRKYPGEYPPVDSQITVTGVFDTYYEGETKYFQLIDAVMTVDALAS